MDPDPGESITYESDWIRIRNTGFILMRIRIRIQIPDSVFHILDPDAGFTLPKKLHIFQVFRELLSFLDFYYQRTYTKYIPGKVQQKM
jgi:hypothetical protein